MKHVRLITDGACLGNPGKGGWACILRYGERSSEHFGCDPHTTNNRMELTAAIEGLKRLKESCSVEIITDSEYVKNGITSWIHGWKRKGWLNSDKKPVKNQDLWMMLDELAAGHQAVWRWTKGHASHEDNNRCDELANRAAREQISNATSATADVMGGRHICLFGGTFDPIHNAHLTIAEEAASRFSLNEIVFVPAANPPHKELGEVTPYEDRFQMVALACAPYPKFLASRLEEGSNRSYTVNTLERFRKELGPKDRLFFLIGSDAFDELETWKRWREVVKLTNFIVVARPGIEYHIPENARIERLDGLDLPVASTRIRARLALGEPTPELPPAVRKFIEERGLYGAGRKRPTASSSRSTDRKLPSGA